MFQHLLQQLLALLVRRTDGEKHSPAGSLAKCIQLVQHALACVSALRVCQAHYVSLLHAGCSRGASSSFLSLTGKRLNTSCICTTPAFATYPIPSLLHTRLACFLFPKFRAGEKRNYKCGDTTDIQPTQQNPHGRNLELSMPRRQLTSSFLISCLSILSLKRVLPCTHTGRMTVHASGAYTCGSYR